MNIQKLQALLTAIDLGSFSRAAERLGYTQSGLTHMMKSLEDEFGFSLLLRGHFGIRPTEECERLLPKIRHLVAMQNELAEDACRIREGGGAALRVGAYSSVAAHWLPSILQSFCREHPHVAVEITQGSVSELYEGLAEDRFDLILVSKNDRYPCAFIPLWDDELRAILPKDFPKEASASFPIECFAKERFLMPSFGFDIDIMTVFDAHGIKPRVISTFVDDPTILSMVEHGLGVSILSELCIRGRSADVLCLPIEPATVRTLGIATKNGKRPSEIMRRFIGHAKKFTEGFEKEKRG